MFLRITPGPAHVRELLNALERAISAAINEPVLFPKHLPTYIRVQLARASVGIQPFSNEIQDEPPKASNQLKLAEVREAAMIEVERNYLKELVSVTGGDVSEACLMSGLSRSRLYALLKKYNILKSA